MLCKKPRFFFSRINLPKQSSSILSAMQSAVSTLASRSSCSRQNRVTHFVRGKPCCIEDDDAALSAAAQDVTMGIPITLYEVPSSPYFNMFFEITLLDDDIVSEEEVRRMSSVVRNCVQRFYDKECATPCAARCARAPLPDRLSFVKLVQKHPLFSGPQDMEVRGGEVRPEGNYIPQSGLGNAAG